MLHWLKYFYILVFVVGCQPLKKVEYTANKIKGICLVAPKNQISDTTFVNLKEKGIKSLALMPYGFLKNGGSSLFFSKDSTESFQWWGERPNGIKTCIRQAHLQGMSIMLKPHIWLQNGGFTGDFSLETEEEWLEFERTYKEYILLYAKIAEEENVKIYCFATEMERMMVERPDFFKQLVKEIKEIYKGKLTYAANWDEYPKVPIWNELDFVGIDAYFPLSEEKSPQKKSLIKSWKNVGEDLSKFSSMVQKPILFTEIGYRSEDYSTRRPWEYHKDEAENEGIQVEAYEAFFESMYNEPYFSGAYIWKWFVHTKQDRYSPKGKKAEQTLIKFFKK